MRIIDWSSDVCSSDLLPEARIAAPEGGYYVWLTLPSHIDGDMLATKAGEVGVHLIAGSRFFASTGTDVPRNHIRLAFSYTTPTQIEEGVRRLDRKSTRLNSSH